MYTCLKIDQIPLRTYSHMKRHINLGKSWCRRKCKYFRMHIRKYNRAFGRDVYHKRAYHESWHYRFSKQTRSRGATFFFPFPFPSFFTLPATRCCTASACMQRQYFECIMNGARTERGRGGEREYRQGGPRGCGLSILQKFHFHILHSRNTVHLQQQFFVSASTHVSHSRVFSTGADRGLHCRRARVCVVERTVLFFVFDVEAHKRTTSLGDENKYARAAENGGKTYFEINEQN